MIAVVVWEANLLAGGSMRVVGGGGEVSWSRDWNQKIIGFRFCVRISGVWRVRSLIIVCLI
jgi:hypothetical protein